MWVSIPNQGSMKYEIYSSREHGNVIEQQMPDIHVQNHYNIHIYIVQVSVRTRTQLASNMFSITLLV